MNDFFFFFLGNEKYFPFIAVAKSEHIDRGLSEIHAQFPVQNDI